MSALCCTGGRLRLVAVGAAVLVLVGHWALCAAEDQKAVIRKPQGAVATEVGMGDLYAVVVGVSKYKHPKIPQLKVSDKDARDFAEFLKKQTKLFKKVHLTVLLNENATKQALETHLFYKLRKAGKDDTVLVFLSGHGADDPNTPGEFFFLTHDADPELLAVTAVHMNRQWFLTKLESKRIVLIADACHAGGFGGGVTKALTRSRENLLQIFKESEGKIFITSSRPDQTSAEKPEYGHSLFTHYLLEGLAGKADLDQDGVVTLRELYEYVYKKTHAESKGNQSPQIEGRMVGSFPISFASLQPSPVTRTEPPGASQATPSELDSVRIRAEQGDPNAQFKLGLMLEFGINVASDKTEAIKWYQRAADKGNKDAKKAMARLQAGPGFSSPTPQGSTPSLRAAGPGIPRSQQRNPAQDGELTKFLKQGDLDFLRNRYRMGGDVDRQVELEEDAAFKWAAFTNNVPTLDQFMSKGEDVKAEDIHGSTVLHWAAASASLEAMEFLISKGAEVNAKDKAGRTPLYWAVTADSVKAAKLLISKGAQVDERNKAGQALLSFAKNNPSMWALLRKHGATE